MVKPTWLGTDVSIEVYQLFFQLSIYILSVSIYISMLTIKVKLNIFYYGKKSEVQFLEQLFFGKNFQQSVTLEIHSKNKWWRYQVVIKPLKKEKYCEIQLYLLCTMKYTIRWLCVPCKVIRSIKIQCVRCSPKLFFWRVRTFVQQQQKNISGLGIRFIWQAC